MTRKELLEELRSHLRWLIGWGSTRINRVYIPDFYHEGYISVLTDAEGEAGSAGGPCVWHVSHDGYPAEMEDELIGLLRRWIQHDQG